MKHRGRFAVGALVVLLLLLLLWSQRAGETGRSPPPGGAPPAPLPAGPAPPAEGPPPPAPADPASGPAGARPEAPPDPDPGPAAAAAPAPASPAGPGVHRLALVPLPRRDPDPPPSLPPVPEDGVRIGGDRGGLSPSGWQKWKPVPEKGTASFAGTVVDEGGRPLGGAEVYRLPPVAGGAEGEVISFRHVKTVATTGPDGTFEAKDQPAGPARLLANWHRALHRPKGLLLSGVVPVDPAERERVAGLQLAVPVNRDGFGAVAGTVLDDEGKPLPGVRVFAGFQEARPDAGGGFRIEGVAAGTVEVTALRHGWSGFRREVEVPPGGEATVDVVLSPKGAGSNVLAGKVADTDGNPVAGVRVWAGGTADLSRETTTDAEGAFLFRRLPDPGDAGVSVSVMADPGKAGVMPATVQGVRVPTRDLLVTVERSVLLRIVVREAGTGRPIPLFNVSLERERVVDGAARTVRFRSATLHEEDGVWEVPVPRDRIVLFVEAPGREPVHGYVAVPGVEGTMEVVIEM